MPQFTIGPDTMSADACSQCCCLEAHARPGETAPWRINFAPWVATIQGRGLVPSTEIDVALLSPAQATVGGNPAPVVTAPTFNGTRNASIVGDLADSADDADTLTFAKVPLYGPNHGVLTLDADGSFNYAPTVGFVGYDEFYFTVSDGVNKPVMERAVLIVSEPNPAPALPTPPARPRLFIDPQRIRVSSPFLEFALTVDPATPVGSTWRMTVRQAVLDCDGYAFHRVTCFDVIVGKC